MMSVPSTTVGADPLTDDQPMQIDFHHGVTYVVARLAGFNHPEANIIAHSAQYVDDAINQGVIRFKNSTSIFRRISSAHRLLDYRNFESLAKNPIWIPFHFLPNGGDHPDQDLVDKLVCRPNSPVAQKMVRECIKQRNDLYGLHRLGITMHVLADTWAHQGFAGINHEINKVSELVDAAGQPDYRLRDRLAGYFVSKALPLGHGGALSYPDRPYLIWGYTNGRREIVRRHNPQDFLTAADEMCKAMQRYQLGDPDALVSGLLEPDRSHIAYLLNNITSPDKKERHQQWLKYISQGDFSFGASQVSYIDKGVGSWKHTALGTAKAEDATDEVFTYQNSFLSSNWKLFHDALQVHQIFVLHDLLPPYGICMA
jgi:hypothetical protein